MQLNGNSPNISFLMNGEADRRAFNSQRGHLNDRHPARSHVNNSLTEHVLGTVQIKERENRARLFTQLPTQHKTSIHHTSTLSQLNAKNGSSINNVSTGLYDDTLGTDNNDTMNNTSKRLRGHISIFNDDGPKKRTLDNRRSSNSSARMYTKVELQRKVGLQA